MAERPGMKPNHQASGKKKNIQCKLTLKKCYIFSIFIMWVMQKEDALVGRDGSGN